MPVDDADAASNTCDESDAAEVDLGRWEAEGLTARDLSSLAPFLGSDLRFERLLTMMIGWRQPGESSPYSRPQELMKLVDSGLSVARVAQFVDSGMRGHQLFLWLQTTVPSSEWLAWAEIQVSPKDGARLGAQGLTPGVARPWVEAGIRLGHVLQFIELGATPDQAKESEDSDIFPDRLERSADGLKYLGPEIFPWEIDPVEQLPDVIEAGTVALTIWSADYGGGADPTAFDVTFYWPGGRNAEWYSDISGEMPGLSVMSSAPISGSVSWINGRDLSVTYQSNDLGLDGKAVLEGDAPTSATPDSDDCMREPNVWVEFAQRMLRFTYEVVD
jgi:hypothetical protein